jgi:hypothetical protein
LNPHLAELATQGVDVSCDPFQSGGGPVPEILLKEKGKEKTTQGSENHLT